MKRLFAVACIVLMTVSIASAQTTITFDNPDITFTFKRCTCSGKIAYIDFLVTNNTESDCNGYVKYDEEKCAGFPGYYTAAYDDEGNIYTAHSEICKISKINIAGASPSYIDNYLFNLPVGVPVKMRVTLSGVDEYAAEITLLKITFRNMRSPNVYGIALMEARNIPITR